MFQTFARTFSLKKSFYFIWLHGEELVVHRDAHALLAFAHAEGSAKLDLVAEIVFVNKILELLNYLARSLDVAGGTDANGYFHSFHLFHE